MKVVQAQPFLIDSRPIIVHDEVPMVNPQGEPITDEEGVQKIEMKPRKVPRFMPVIRKSIAIVNCINPDQKVYRVEFQQDPTEPGVGGVEWPWAAFHLTPEEEYGEKLREEMIDLAYEVLLVEKDRQYDPALGFMKRKEGQELQFPDETEDKSSENVNNALKRD